MTNTATQGDTTASDEKAASWEQAHQALTQLARARAGLDFDEGTWLLAAFRSGTHARLGYGSFVEYIERLFGYAPRLTHDKLRVAEALEQLPELGHALRDGGASWSSLRELTRVATPKTERAWLEAARGRTTRDVERLVAGRRRGSLPSDPTDDSARRHLLRFEVSGEALASFREAIAKIRRDAGGPLDDDAALLLMARHVLGGPIDEGRASYQVALTLCEGCQRARLQAQGEMVDVTPDVVEMARCDAQHLGQTHRGPIPAPADGDVPTHSETPTDSDTPTDSNTPTDSKTPTDSNTPIDSKTPTDSNTPIDSKTPALSNKTTPSRRAKQDVPPALRRLVLRRDEHRCQVPGCRHATWVDIHHVVTREDGGAHEADNLVTLCGAHHRASHRGGLIVQGRVSAGLRFLHADGTDYGCLASAASAGAQAQAFRALRGLGFGEGETRRALSEVVTHSGQPASTELALRSALQRLTARGLARAP